MAETIIMSPTTFAKLPADIQGMIEELGLWYQNEAIKMDTSEIDRAMQFSTKENHTVTNLTSAEIQAWKDAALAIHEQWIANMEKQGKPAREIYNEIKALIAAIK